MSNDDTRKSVVSELERMAIQLREPAPEEANTAIWVCATWEEYQKRSGMYSLPEDAGLAECAGCGVTLIYNKRVAPSYIRKLCHDCASKWEAQAIEDGEPPTVVMSPKAMQAHSTRRTQIEEAANKLKEDES